VIVTVFNNDVSSEGELWCRIKTEEISGEQTHIRQEMTLACGTDYRG